MRYPSRQERVIRGVCLAATALVLLPGAILAGQSAQSLGVHQHESGDVDVVLLEVARTSGDTVTVRWKYVNNSGEKKQLTHERTGWLDPYRLASDAYVLDTVSHTKYTVVVDDDKHPIAGKHGGQNSYIYLAPHQSLVTWAKFPAPAAGVSKVTISIPGTDPFEDVPLGTGTSQ
jgi:hypothetical protein